MANVDLPGVALKPRHERRVLRGHPWIFSNEIATPLAAFEPGDVVQVFAAGGRPLGVGYVNPHSLIAIRLLRRDSGPLDAPFLASRVEGALDLRRRLFPHEEALRLIFSEGDGLPGLIVDRYGDHLVLQVTTAGMERLLPLILGILLERLRPRAVVARNDLPARRLEDLPQGVDVLHGDPNPDLEVTYESLRLAVDVTDGQKTGLFLDQRDNQRALLGRLAQGRVLDAYCYQGAWGLLALVAGAEHLTGIDQSAGALALASRHARANNLADRVTWEEADVNQTLKRLRSQGRQFDLVILDPPAFVKSKRTVRDGLKGYLHLNRKGIGLVAPGGYLITCSCSHHVRSEVFLDTVAHAASLAKRPARLLEQRGQSRDHPALITAPETSYLKCLALQLE